MLTNIVTSMRPTITSATGCNGGDIDNGGTTTDSSILLRGSAEPTSVVYIYDGENLLGTASVLVDGSWSIEVQELSVGEYVFTARTLDGQGSNIWAVTVSGTAPVIREAVDGVLDIRLLTNNAQVTVLAWPGYCSRAAYLA
jgi:uncharacterized protein YjdB